MATLRSIGTGDTKGVPVTLTGATENLVLTTDAVPTPNEVTLLFILAIVAWTAGATVTAMQLRLRRGAALASPQVGDTYQHAATAAAKNSAVMCATDQVDNNYTVQYSLTVQQVGATGDGSADSAQILVLAF